MSKKIDLNQAVDLAGLANTLNGPEDCSEDVVLGNLAVMLEGDGNAMMELLLRSAVRLASMTFPPEISDKDLPFPGKGHVLSIAGDDRFACKLVYGNFPIDDKELN